MTDPHPTLRVGLTRHGAEALLAYLREELTTADAERLFGHSNPSPLTKQELRFLKLAESTFKGAMRTDGLTFMFPRACSQYLCQCITRHLETVSLDASTAISPSDREELIDLRSQLRKARLLDLPLSIAHKYDFVLHTAGVSVRVSFTENELHKLARGTHECVVFTAVVPSDPTADSQKEQES
jgi:hypothetical protein